ncbi:MAG: polyphenol oxidase family protein [Acidimicrobiales bacterium]|nr:polyphenol oxidase family protein [Acidimicrobiales bacterium]
MRLGPAEVRFTDRSDGDFRQPASTTHVTADFPWTWLRQVHGADVVVVEEPGARAGDSADAAIAVVPGAPIAIVTADCAPVVLVDDAGASVAVAHAGWRGLYDGVLGATVVEMHKRGAGSISAALGPCIHAGCYEFSDTDLQPMVDRFGAAVRATSTKGTPSLDMVAAVRAALEQAEVELVEVVDTCTSCSLDYWSHRARQDEQRQATVAWLS